MTTEQQQEQWLHIDSKDPNLGWLPIDIVVSITLYITPRQRLVGLTRINKVFHKMIYSPSCFKDLWIVPVIPKDLKKIKKPNISLVHKYGRSCILVNFAMRHEFVSKVISFLDRWYLRSDELIIRSKQNRTRFQDPFYWIKTKCVMMEIDINCDYNNNQLLKDRNIDIESLPNIDNISSLFITGIDLIEYNIIFPSTLNSLHLQSFENNLFGSNLWKTQIINEKRFKLIEYLSLYQCHFDVGEIQFFSMGCPILSILEIIESAWKGIFYLPSTLKSIRWKAIRGKLSFKKCDENNLMECIIPQISKSILNALRNYKNIKRLVLFSKNTYTLSQDDYYHFSDPWDKHKDLIVVYHQILEKKDKNLKTNLKIIFPNALLQSVHVIQRNDYSIWQNKHKYIKMLKGVTL